MDFSKSIFENRRELNRPLLAAHRGVCGANVPCNSIAAYKIENKEEINPVLLLQKQNRKKLSLR